MEFRFCTKRTRPPAHIPRLEKKPGYPRLSKRTVKKKATIKTPTFLHGDACNALFIVKQIEYEPSAAKILTSTKGQSSEPRGRSDRCVCKQVTLAIQLAAGAGGRTPRTRGRRVWGRCRAFGGAAATAPAPAPAPALTDRREKGEVGPRTVRSRGWLRALG
ncbi:hypothetical protein EVAR_53500_1 [Eumeta japonica]|uniref:Uncharacterized protein n=1 Tax=Eumeta variegata TaxID=151549 RepID=A0A4C1Y4L6_EUMVA|nr:hypothetical protein EVAR_53500_1 [Eumeta japonica]